MSNPGYVDWLKDQRVPLFAGGGVYWKTYQGALIPVCECDNAKNIQLGKDEARSLLAESRAWLLRYSTDLSDTETAWWYLVCDRFDPRMISAKTRETVNRGKRRCSVRQVSGEWLASNGYECYEAAFRRYSNATPVSAEVFRKNMLRTLDGPFEYYGVFVENHLAGYSHCVIEERDAVSFRSSKYHPDYLRHQISYAHVSGLIDDYVSKRGMSLYSGLRSISHDTKYQDLLLKLGHRRQFCRLCIVYQPWLNLAVRLLFPLQRWLARLPDRGPLHNLNAVLYQEGLRRECGT